MIHKAYELYKAKYGNTAQKVKAIEELSELIKALSKDLLKEGIPKENRLNIIDEIADVNIMITQLIIMFDCKKEVLDRIDYKIKRMIERVKPSENEQ